MADLLERSRTAMLEEAMRRAGFIQMKMGCSLSPGSGYVEMGTNSTKSTSW